MECTAAEEIKQLGMSDQTKYDDMTINEETLYFYKKPKRFLKLKTFYAHKQREQKHHNQYKLLYVSWRDVKIMYNACREDKAKCPT
jgi:hypothetical protein